MNRLKSVFIFLYCCYLPIGLVMSIAGFISNPEAVAWYAAILSHLAGIGWFVYIYFSRLKNASIVGLAHTVISGTAFLIALGQYKIEGNVSINVIYLTGAALVMWIFYHQWYAKLSGNSLRIKEGDPFTPSVLGEGSGDALDLSTIQGKKLLVFHRGNWCPFCVGQLQELALDYDKLSEHQVTVIAISTNDPKFNKILAQRLNVPFHFIQDTGMAVSTALGLDRPNSLPLGLQVLGYESNLIAPAVILLDEQNNVLATYESKDYRTRPGSSYFLRYIESKED